MPTFTIMGSGIGYMGGNYKNEQPSQAAKKAAKALFKKLKERKYAKYKNKTSIKFVLRMRDRSGPGKTYAYLATQIKLKKPLVVKRGDVEYTVQYDYKIEPCNLAEKEVKTMTLGQLTVIGGKMVHTGKRLLKGGSDGEEIEEDEVEVYNNDNTDEDEDGVEGGDEGVDKSFENEDTDEITGGGKKKKKKKSTKKSPAKKSSTKNSPAKR